MKPLRTTINLTVLLLMLAATSCNLPTTRETGPENSQEEVFGFVAQTMQAQQTQTSTPTVISTLTGPPAAATVTVTTATNCRTGPGQVYDFVMLFSPGMTATVIGKYTPSYYWIITMPNGGTCWLLGAYANVQGDLSTLPEMTAPQPPVAVVITNPTANVNDNENTDSGDQNSGSDNAGSQGTGGNDSGSGTGMGPLTIVTPLVFILVVPLTPTSLKAASYCEYNSAHQVTLRTDTLTWTKVNNVDGYIIYMNSAQIFKVSNTTLGYQISPEMSPNATTYGIASYKGSATSDVRSVTPKGCP